MGSVRIDLHKNERQYQLANFSDIEVVKGLILLRHKLDKYYRRDQSYPMDFGGCLEMNVELIVLYADLDELVKRTRLSKPQRALMQLLQNDMTPEDIEFFVGIPQNEIIKSINLICRRIVEQNNQDWLVWANLNYIKTEWKTCPSCGDSLPASKAFFYEDGETHKIECKHCYRQKIYQNRNKNAKNANFS